MTGRTISNTYSSGISLTSAGDNPLTVLASASITSASGLGLYAASGTYWTIANAGRVNGYNVGVSFAGSGTLTNTGEITSSQTTAPSYYYNTIAYQFTPLSGGVLMAGGGVSNDVTGLITGYYEGVAIGGGGHVVNAGKIQTGNYGFGVVLTNSGSVSNAATGTIDAGRYGIFELGTGASVSNAGLINAYSGVGVDLYGGGSITNTAGTIAGAYYGVITGGTITSTIVNQADITGTQKAGVDLLGSATLSNSAIGSISGANYGIAARATAAVYNSGSITAQSAIGVALFAGGQVSNAGSGFIGGSRFGVAEAPGAAATVVNQGTITGATYAGVLLYGGGSVSNTSGGTVTGGSFGVYVVYAAGTVTNLGSISSSATFPGAGSFDAAGVDLADGGVVTNGVSGDIRATWKGVEIGSISSDVGGTVLNQGVIYASNSSGSTGAAVWIHGPGVISNASTGTIAGGPFAIVAYYQTTLINAGTIEGAEFAFDAIFNSSGPGYADLVIVDPGAKFVGEVSGGNPIGNPIFSTLELASGSSQGTIGSLGTQFVDFGQIQIDPDASWAFTGSNSLAAGVTLIDFGSMMLSGLSLTDAGSTTISGASAFASATVTGAGAVWDGTGALVVADQGAAALSILNGGTVNAGEMDIGVTAGASGTVTISGTGSRLNVADTLNIGDAGAAEVILGAGTELTVANTINVGAQGTLTQSGGTIDPGTFAIRQGGAAGGSGQDSFTTELANSGTFFADGTLTVNTPLVAVQTLGQDGTLEIRHSGDLVLNAASVAATQTVTFDDGVGVLTIGTLSGFAATIGNFNNGDAITVLGTTIAETSFNASSHVLTLYNGAHAVAGSLQFGASVTDGSDIKVNGIVPCFMVNTRIATPHGELPVQAMRVGDKVRVLSGHDEPIVWIGHRSVDCVRHPEPHRVWPVRVSAHAFGNGRPARDLWLSPDHALFIDDVLVPVKYLINGTTIVQRPRSRVSYYHIELPRHAVLWAEGMTAESYLDAGDRSNFANSGAAVTLYPDFTARLWEAEGCAPLVVTGPKLAEIRDHLYCQDIAENRAR